MSVAEDTFGKGIFCGFVTAVQRRLCDKRPTLQSDNNLFIIKADGELEPVTEEEKDRRWNTNGQVAYMRVHLQRWDNRFVVMAYILHNLPESGRTATVGVDAFKDGAGKLDLRVELGEVSAEAAAGLMLAICMGNPEATPAHWIALLGGSSLVVGRQSRDLSGRAILYCIADALVRPLMAALSFVCLCVWGERWGAA